MTWQDFFLLVKKIAVGVAITLIPLFILVGGLRLTRQFLSAPHPTQNKGTGQ